MENVETTRVSTYETTGNPWILWGAIGVMVNMTISYIAIVGGHKYPRFKALSMMGISRNHWSRLGFATLPFPPLVILMGSYALLGKELETSLVGLIGIVALDLALLTLFIYVFGTLLRKSRNKSSVG